jgi:hypothetical protein
VSINKRELRFEVEDEGSCTQPVCDEGEERKGTRWQFESAFALYTAIHAASVDMAT